MSDGYLYRLRFTEGIPRDQVRARSKDRLNSEGHVIRAPYPIRIGEHISAAGGHWEVVDILHEFARDYSYETPYPDYREAEQWDFDEYGAILKVKWSRVQTAEVDEFDE